MLFNNPTQFAVLALLLFVGWLFGFASHSGGKRWKTAYQDEAVGRAHDREELDQQLRQVDGRVRTLESEKTALETRNAELTGELEQARTIRPAAVPVAPIPARVLEPIAATEARPAFPESAAAPITAEYTPAPAVAPHVHNEVAAAPVAEEPQPLPIKRGWFDWSRGDDLTRLRGVDEALAERLKAEKVDSFAELAALTDQDEVALERRLDLPAGYLMKEELRDQARLLAGGQSDEHATRFGAPAVG